MSITADPRIGSELAGYRIESLLGRGGDGARLASGRNMTRAEWDEIGPRDADYQATCSQFPLER